MRNQPESEQRSDYEGFQPSVQSERVLREHLIESFQKLSTPQLAKIAALIVAFKTDIKVTNLVKTMIAATREAERGAAWNNVGKKNIIHIAYYASDEYFFTIFLHELGHSLLGRLGKVKATSTEEEAKEELFCWQFAELLTAELSVGYANDMVMLYQQLWLAIQKLNDTQHGEEMEALYEQERKMFGYSFYDHDRLGWTDDDRPFVIGD